MISLETQLEKIETEISSIQFMLFTTKGVTASSDQISGAPSIIDENYNDYDEDDNGNQPRRWHC